MNEAIKKKVVGPAIGLIVTASISILFLLMGQCFNIWLLASGTVDRFEDPQAIGMSKEGQIAVRMSWNLLMIITSAVIIYGSVKMIKLKSYGAAKTACILALIPCFGPCFVLGIPFGIWGLVVLNDIHVRKAM